MLKDLYCLMLPAWSRLLGGFDLSMSKGDVDRRCFAFRGKGRRLLTIGIESCQPQNHDRQSNFRIAKSVSLPFGEIGNFLDNVRLLSEL